MTTESMAGTRPVLIGRVGAGAIGGLVGGIVFGFMMAADGMLPMVAMLVGGEAEALGWVVHLAISLFAGTVFGVIAGMLARSWWTAAGLGIGYGAVWWLLGPMLVMPLWQEAVGNEGMAEMVFQWTDATRNSLWGHLVFGFLLGLVFGLLRPRMTQRS